MYAAKQRSTSAREDRVLETPYEMSAERIARIEEFINERWLPSWRKGVHRYRWVGLLQYGLPSPVIRVDMSPCDSLPPERCLYEVETVPEGFDALCAALSEAQQVFFCSRLLGSLDLMNCVGFLNTNSVYESVAHCDSFVAGVLGLPYETSLKDCVSIGNLFVRTPHPTERRLSVGMYNMLRARSVTDLYGHSNKHYLRVLDLAVSMDTLDIPERDVVIKPWEGTRSQRVYIYLGRSWPESKRVAARAKIEMDLAHRGRHEFLIMPYAPPARVENGGVEYDQILRLYFSITSSGYEYAGGITTEIPAESGTEAGYPVQGSREDAVYRPLLLR